MRPAPAEAAGVARLLAVVLAAAVAGALALVAVASISSRPVRFLPAGLVVLVVVLGPGSAWSPATARPGTAGGCAWPGSQPVAWPASWPSR